MLKGKNLMILVLVAVGLYFVWKRMKASKAAAATTDVPTVEATKEAQVAALLQADTAVSG